MTDVTYENEEYGNDAHPDQIKEIPMRERISNSNMLANNNIVDANIQGGKLDLGSGDRRMRFDGRKGLWLGAAEFSNAPFSVNMQGNLIASNAEITGKIVAGTDSDVDWSYISSVEIENADIVDATIEAAKINSLDADDINTGTISASYVQIGSTTDYESGYDPSDKNDTYRQDSEPTSGMSKGDLWIDTDDGDKPYTYNGSSWIQAYTSISGGHIDTGTIDADVVTVDNLNVDNVNSGNLVSAYIGSDLSDSNIDTIDFNNITANNISANSITSGGSITGVDVISSSSGDEIKLDSGDYLRFFAGGTEKASLRATTNGNGGIIAEQSSSFYLENDNAYWIESSGGATGTWGGIAINYNDEFHLVAGTKNKFYFYDNARSNRLMTLDSDGDLFVKRQILRDANQSIQNAAGDIGITSRPSNIAWEIKGNLNPQLDATYQLGNSSYQWSDVYAHNGHIGDLEFENDWVLTEGEELPIDKEGIALLDAKGEMRYFFGKDAFYTPNEIKNIDELK